MTFAHSYLGKLRSLVGSRCLLVPGARVIIGACSEEMRKKVAIREIFEETRTFPLRLQSAI